MLTTENPFASRFVRPGSLPYLFTGDDGACIQCLIDHLASCAWRGAIVGPHGSGKSTLLAELSIQLSRRGFDVQHWVVGQRLCHCLKSLDSPATTLRPTIHFVDGFDRLPTWRQWRLLRHCRRHACGCVVTGHPPAGHVSKLARERRTGTNCSDDSATTIAADPQSRVPVPSQSPMVFGYALGVTEQSEGRSYRGIPVLLHTQTTPKLAERVAAALAGGAFASSALERIGESFARHNGNLREVLFDLYDLYERQTRRERTQEKAGAAPNSRNELGLPDQTGRGA